MYVSGKKRCEVSKGLEGCGRIDGSVRCAWGLAHEVTYCKTWSIAVFWAATARCVIKTSCCISESRSSYFDEDSLEKLTSRPNDTHVASDL